MRLDGRSTLRAAAGLVWIGVIVVVHAGLAAPVRALAPITELTASVVQAILPWLGIEALRAGPMVYQPGGFSYEVALGCTGVSPAAVLAVAIASTPAAGAAKGWGLAVGVLAVFGVNVLRLLHLFHVGVHDPARFERLHGLLWEGAIVLFTFATWLVWSRWAAFREAAAAARRRASGPAVGELAE